MRFAPIAAAQITGGYSKAKNNNISKNFRLRLITGKRTTAVLAPLSLGLLTRLAPLILR